MVHQIEVITAQKTEIAELKNRLKQLTNEVSSVKVSFSRPLQVGAPKVLSSGGIAGGRAGSATQDGGGALCDHWYLACAQKTRHVRAQAGAIHPRERPTQRRAGRQGKQTSGGAAIVPRPIEGVQEFFHR